MDSLTKEQKELVSQAKSRFDVILPCSNKTWKECFTDLEGALAFWYNDSTGSTHMEIATA